MGAGGLAIELVSPLPIFVQVLTPTSQFYPRGAQWLLVHSHEGQAGYFDANPASFATMPSTNAASELYTAVATTQDQSLVKEYDRQPNA